MSAPDEGLRVDTGLSSEYLEQTPAERLEAIKTRLAGDMPERPRMGELATRAEALAEAHAMASDQAERVSKLGPAIARTIRIAAERTGKGQRYLLGSYEGKIYRNGLATLAALNAEQLGVGDDERVEQVMQAVCTVLTRLDGTAASHHAISLLGTIAVDRSGRVADWLSSTGVGTSHPRSLGKHIVTALRQTDEVEKRRDVLRAVAVLVSHERLHSLVDDLPQAVLDDCGAADDTTVQAWTHVVCLELGRDSPVDPADLWQRFRYVSPDESIAWWLLLEYSGPALPIPDHEDATRFEILIQHTRCRTNDAVAGAFTAAALPDALLKTASPMQQAATLLEHEDRTVRHAAACQVVDLITRADVPKNHRTRAVEILGGKQLSSPTARSSGLAALVRLLTAEDTPPALRRRIFDSLVDTIRNTDSPGVRAGATDAFDEIATQNPACVSTTTLDHAVKVVTTLFDHEETFVRRGGIASLASLASIERVTSESISRAVNDLIARLDNQDPAVRRWAAASLSRLAFSDAVSTVQLERAVETLAADLQHDDHKVRARTTDTLGDVIGDVAVDTDLTTAAVRTLLVAITDERSPVRMRTVEGLGDLTDVEQLTTETLGLVVDALADALDDEHPTVGHKAAAALGTLTAHSARTPTHLRTMAAALRDVFRDGGHAKGHAVWALGELLALDAITGDIVVRIVDTLEQALGNHYFFDSVGPKVPQALGKLVVTNSAKN